MCLNKTQDKCKECGKEIKKFCKRCPECKSTVEIEYECRGCKKDVFQSYLPGSGTDGTGKLLDMCRAKIVSIGIKKVVYAEPYTMKEAKKVFEKANVVTERFQGVKSRAYFRLYS